MRIFHLLCLMLFSTYYTQNNAGIIGTGLASYLLQMLSISGALHLHCICCIHTYIYDHYVVDGGWSSLVCGSCSKTCDARPSEAVRLVRPWPHQFYAQF